MRMAKAYAKDIVRMKDAMKRTESKALVNQYSRAIARKTRELREYCRYKGIEYEQVYNGL